MKLINRKEVIELCKEIYIMVSEMKKGDLFDCVGLHPTVAEDIVNAMDPGC